MITASPLTQLVTSRARSKLLLFFSIFYEDRLRFRDIQRRTGLGSRSLQRELARLEELDVVQREGSGRDTRFRARTESPRWLPLWRAVSAFAQPGEVVDLVLAGLSGIDAAFLYGSTARGDARLDSDVDLFLVGERIDEIELARRTSEASAVLGREVNPVIYTRAEIDARLQSGSGYMGRVLGTPKVWLRGNQQSIPEAA